MPRTDTASRVIAAPPERVYGAFVDPDAVTTWLPPDGMSGKLERFDPRSGGTYRLVLTYDDASASPGKTTTNSDIIQTALSISFPANVSCKRSTSFPTTPRIREP